MISHHSCLVGRRWIGRDKSIPWVAVVNSLRVPDSDVLRRASVFPGLDIARALLISGASKCGLPLREKCVISRQANFPRGDAAKVITHNWTAIPCMNWRRPWQESLHRFYPRQRTTFSRRVCFRWRKRCFSADAASLKFDRFHLDQGLWKPRGIPHQGTGWISELDFVLN